MTTEEQQIIDAAAQTATATVEETATATVEETATATVEETATATENMIEFFQKKAKNFAIAHEIVLELQLREAYTHEVLTCKVSAVDDNEINFSELEAIAELLPITDEISIRNECNTRIVALLECMLGKSLQTTTVLSSSPQNEIVN